MKSAKVRQLESKLTLTVDDNAPDVFAEDGTDLTQIRQMLALTPTQRLRHIQSLAQSILRLRRGVKQPVS